MPLADETMPNFVVMIALGQARRGLVAAGPTGQLVGPAGTNIAAVEVAKSAPDSYSLFMNSPAVVINMALYAKPPYDLHIP